jgi:hypothetical protein
LGEVKDGVVGRDSDDLFKNCDKIKHLEKKVLFDGMV